MSNEKEGLSRREFIRTSAGWVSVASLGSAAASPMMKTLSGVRIAPDSPLPLITAAAEISQKKSLPVRRAATEQPIASGEIVLALGSDAAAHLRDIGQLETAGQEWELVRQLPAGGILITGATARNVCRAALAWLENPAGEEDRLSVFRFAERFTMWDNALNQWYRFSTGFDREAHIRQIVLTGHTGVEINRYADPGGYHVLHRKFPYDSYAWYMSYAPALDAFVESSLTQGIYPPEELAVNLADVFEIAKKDIITNS